MSPDNLWREYYGNRFLRLRHYKAEDNHHCLDHIDTAPLRNVLDCLELIPK